jgi:hypothetical protein
MVSFPSPFSRHSVFPSPILVIQHTLSHIPLLTPIIEIFLSVVMRSEQKQHCPTSSQLQRFSLFTPSKSKSFPASYLRWGKRPHCYLRHGLNPTCTSRRRLRTPPHISTFRHRNLHYLKTWPVNLPLSSLWCMRKTSNLAVERKAGITKVTKMATCHALRSMFPNIGARVSCLQRKRATAPHISGRYNVFILSPWLVHLSKLREKMQPVWQPRHLFFAGKCHLFIRKKQKACSNISGNHCNNATMEALSHIYVIVFV